MSMRPHVPRAKIRAQSPVLAVVLLAILVMVSAVLGWLGGLADSAGRAGRVRVLPAGSPLTPASVAEPYLGTEPVSQALKSAQTDANYVLRTS